MGDPGLKYITPALLDDRSAIVTLMTVVRTEFTITQLGDNDSYDKIEDIEGNNSNRS